MVVDVDKALAMKRLRLLIEQVKAEVRFQRATAERIGMSETLISKLLNSRPGVSIETVHDVIRHMRLSEKFFTDPKAKNPDYREYLQGANSDVPRHDPAVFAFLATDHGLRAISEREQDALDQWCAELRGAKIDPTPERLREHVLSLRAKFDDVIAARAFLESVERRLRERGGSPRSTPPPPPKV